MKSSQKLFLATALMTMGALSFTSCSDNDDPEDVRTTDLGAIAASDYNANGVWNDVFTAKPLTLGDFTLSHTGGTYSYDGYEYSSWYGFSPSRMSNKEDQTDWYGDYQFSNITGGGIAGAGSPFIVGFWDVQETDATDWHQRSMLITLADKTFEPKGVFVTNACVAYYTMLNGNAFSAPFKEGDWFKLNAFGVKADGSVTAPVSFNLANCKGSDKDKWFATSWEWFDLTALGEVQAVYFTMSSSSTGDYGMNNPAYVAMDQFMAVI